MMMGTKPAITSLGVWGPLVAALAVVLQLAGLDPTSTNGLAEDIVALIGAAIGIYGRVKAIKQIDRIV